MNHWAMTSLAALCAVASPAQAAPWKHKYSKLQIPDQVTDLKLTNVKDAENNGLDVIVNFGSAEGGESTTIYVFRKTSGDVPVWFDRAAALIVVRPEFGRVTATTQPTSFIPPGQATATGLKQVFSTAGGEWKSTAVALIQMGGWYVKLRLSSTTRTPDELAVRLEQTLVSLKWPTKLAAGPVATPITACTTPLSFAAEAALAPADPSAGLMAAVLASGAGAAAAGAANANVKVKGRIVLEKPGVWCRDSAIVGDGDQSSLVAVYRNDSQTDGYLLALGDSGRAISIGRNSLAAILAEEGKVTAPTWTPSLILLDRTIVYRDFASLAPPIQLLAVADKGKVLATARTFGDKTAITISSDAFQ